MKLITATGASPACLL